jgi:hypothetical protein
MAVVSILNSRIVRCILVPLSHCAFYRLDMVDVIVPVLHIYNIKLLIINLSTSTVSVLNFS